MNSAVVAPVVRAMHCDPRVRFYFTSSEHPDQARQIFSDLQPGGIISPRRAAAMRFDAYLTADLTWARLPRGTKRVLMFHGVAGKYSKVYDAPDRSMRHWDRIFFINRRRLENFISAGAINASNDAARLIGYPKLDSLVDGSLQRDEILRANGIDPSATSVLYAPTWSPYSSLNSIGERLVQRLCEVGYRVIVKLHDRSYFPEWEYSGGIDWAARLEPILERSGGVLVRASDLTPYLAAADVMITDHSSAGFEYLLVDRPLIRIEMPALISSTMIPPEYVRLLARASTTVHTVTEALEAVETNLANPSEKTFSRKAVAEELFFEPGFATKRAVRELYEVIELDAPFSFS